MTTTDIHGTTVLTIDSDGPLIATPGESNDLIGAAWGEEATLVALPAVRLHPDFFRLDTLFAGEFLQKFANYRIQIVILGDITPHVAASSALHDFVWESNRGTQVWFLPDLAALTDKLALP